MPATVFPLNPSWLERALDVWLVGCGGSGSEVLDGLARIDRALRALGDGPGRSELLSYVLFDEEYFAASYDRGVEAARRCIADLPSGVGGRWTWRTRPVSGRMPASAEVPH